MSRSKWRANLKKAVGLYIFCSVYYCHRCLFLQDVFLYLKTVLYSKSSKRIVSQQLLTNVLKHPVHAPIAYEEALQEKPTNCGTKAADVIAKQIFLPVNFNENQLNIWVHLQLL